MKQILTKVSFQVPSGQVMAVIGPSGAGKSSLLRLVNRLDEPTEGDIWLAGSPYRSLAITQLRRTVGMVFQAPALFDGTVADNIAYGPRLRGATPSEQRAKAESCLARVGLEPDLIDRDSSTLSGGQQQRVAFARAIANDPAVLLCDEVTSALDPASSTRIEALLRGLSRDHGLTILLVTHDLGLARRVADRVLVLAGGRVLEEGPAETVFSAPVHPETAGFLAAHTGASLPRLQTKEGGIARV
jgi:ABC-type methionine transport system ATPase subunit